MFFSRPFLLFAICSLLFVIATSAVDASAIAFSLENYCKENEALIRVVEVVPSFTKSDCQRVVDESIKRGWWEVTEKIISECQSSQPKRDVTSAVYKAKSSISSKLTSMVRLLNKKKNVKTIITPAFQWAQSRTHIYINIKLSHKLDTPATLGCKITNSDLTDRVLRFRADCPKKEKSFFLSLETLKSIVPSESTYEMAAVGRIDYVMQKEIPGPWSRLLKSRQKPRNMHTWWDMQQKHKGTLYDKDPEKSKPVVADDDKVPKAKLPGSAGEATDDETNEVVVDEEKINEQPEEEVVQKEL